MPKLLTIKKGKAILITLKCEKCPALKKLVQYHNNGQTRETWEISNKNSSCVHKWVEKR